MVWYNSLNVKLSCGLCFSVMNEINKAALQNLAMYVLCNIICQMNFAVI